MTTVEYLLACLAEECNEVAQRAMKAQRFGLDGVEPGQTLTNAERLMKEYVELVAVQQMLTNLRHLPMPLPNVFQNKVEEKQARVWEYMEYSR
jgi:NTP pyrophosphatase (non-canonical NTP hydrolase)